MILKGNMRNLIFTTQELMIHLKIFGNSLNLPCKLQQESVLSFQLLFYQLVIVNYNNHHIQIINPFPSFPIFTYGNCSMLFDYSQFDMIDTQHYSLYRKYRAAIKNDDDMFSIKYVLADESKPSSKDQAERIERENKHGESIKFVAKQHEKKGFHPRRKDNKHEQQEERHHNKFVQKHEKKERKYEAQQKQIPKAHYVLKSQTKPQIKTQAKPVEVIKGETQQPIQLSPLKKSKDQYQLMQELVSNDDDIVDELQDLQLKSKRSKSSEFRQIFPEMELARKSQMQIYQARKLFDDYVDIQTIEQSRQQGEKIYLKGIVQFADTVKWYCNIISSEAEGILVAEGRATNRACHEDEVYYKIIGEEKQKTKCTVVAILHKKITEIVGKIQFSKTKQSYLLRPTNTKFASMKINLNEFKKQWLPDVYSKYFLAQFTSWEATEDLPSCKIISQYGFFGQVEIETKALLKAYGVEQRSYEKEDIERFLEPFKNNISQNGQYTIPQEELKKRRDFRKWRTFYVKDGGIDASFSITPLNLRTKADPNFLKKNIYEINAHFADVSYFVRQNSALDQQIKKKGVSYNLIYKILPLLPQPFSNTFCAFRQGKDIITISISFQVDQDGNLQEGSKNTKSIITPQFFFTFEQLEKIIGENPVSNEEWKSWNCGCKGQPDYRSISADIKLMNRLISKRRENRIKSGALAFQIPIKSFKLASDFSAKNFQLKLKSKAMSMIEECVISTSLKTAEFLFKNIKNKTILYRHKFPGFKKLLRFTQSLSKIGQKVPQNPNQILKFLNDLVTGTTLKQSHREVIKYLTIKLLDNFDFFQPLGTDPTSWPHFVINVAMYTHISTPRQSYADLLVQRQLITAIEGQTWKISDIETAELLEGCNKAKLISQHIQAGCEKVFLCLYLRANPVFTKAVVMSIQQWGIKVCIPKFNFKNLIKFKSLTSITVTKMSTDESSRKYVKLDYSKITGQIKTKFVLKQMQQIDISIRSANSYPLDYVVSLALPHPTQPGQKIMID